ncbi:MAG: 6-carboxytetrahydropterin synthase [Bacteroidales bacterium]|jgi:6-pyruvoyltetrahydropterin/6-carboxytetrahydropterin synthase|nr:6-carboxytetrahydropterin synthase [Bacteroidales bacterium]MDD2570483.1 6-carboxytetrahydropterin synthase [Bacteroidales bacterium]MDD2813502.1 6-carboxytetrahydropterin synthase [Bacteroidales bacterium]MDD3384259.1 6-carboxytetrahydropterin synthase [Bacteroidales bacterium]MDD3812202.1 6-carboxytetrahydropterin synthase [Bacteroidales bacterium]
MAKVRVTKIFRFEMAHALWGYDGLCRSVHGHSYILKITVSGTPIEDPNNIKLGMVMDFGDLKRLVHKYIVDVYDHSLVLSKRAPVELIEQIPEMFERRIWVDFQPTAENLVLYYASLLKDKFPEGITLETVRLYETANSYAEWQAE